ncbi:hypothetical protein THS5294_00656 [Thalassobacter stenotrophicus]|uniref:Uncharacterized protein n=2 Tax=Thalassobacter stenotrophicus TaxID=266809 RepID=A0A0P1EWR5_9RHOB|nr:hypothetical protein THS5294_00656 [Thalassobacter stenotrophicus]SHI85342.1 hypothetical protein SAMN02744035_01855 [Thalassobacter stenotrophicus DSM 16310]
MNVSARSSRVRMVAGHSREKPALVIEINRTVSQLRKTMRRNREMFPPSLRNQLSNLVGHSARIHARNLRYVHPGMKKMAEWGECSERQARANFSMLKAAGVIVPHSYGNGGRRAARFKINPIALKVWLVRQGAKPHPTLLARLDRFLTPKNREFS